MIPVLKVWCRSVENLLRYLSFCQSWSQHRTNFHQLRKMSPVLKVWCRSVENPLQDISVFVSLDHSTGLIVCIFTSSYIGQCLEFADVSLIQNQEKIFWGAGDTLPNSNAPKSLCPENQNVIMTLIPTSPVLGGGGGVHFPLQMNFTAHLWQISVFCNFYSLPTYYAKKIRFSNIHLKLKFMSFFF